MSFAEWADFLRAVAAFGWMAVAVAIVIRVWGNVPDFFRRIKTLPTPFGPAELEALSEESETSVEEAGEAIVGPNRALLQTESTGDAGRSETPEERSEGLHKERRARQRPV